MQGQLFDEPPVPPVPLRDVFEAALARVGDEDLLAKLLELATAKAEGDRAGIRAALRELRRKYGWSIAFLGIKDEHQ